MGYLIKDTTREEREALVDPNTKDKDTLALFKYIADEDKLEKFT